MSNKEPKRLKRGKAFHKQIQREWLETAGGEVKVEKGCVKPSGQWGRIDIFVNSDENNDKLVACAEIKASDWDSMSEKSLYQNVRRQAKQIWDYIESQLALGKEVSPGIIFPQKPKNPNRLGLIEKLFDEEGIPVVWMDESTEERKKRALES